MKVQLTMQTRAGEVAIEFDSPGDVAMFVREMNATKKASPRRGKPLAIESTDESLSQPLVDTWNWLVANNNPEGVGAADVAAGLGINIHTANYRLRQLFQKSLAHQPSAGRYRPGEA